MEDLERVELLPHAEELHGHAGRGADREARATAGVAVHLREDEPADRQARLERGRREGRVLSGHRVDDEQDLVRLGGRHDRFDLAHHLVVDVQPAGAVDDHRVGAVALRGRHRGRHVIRDAAGLDGDHPDAQLLAERAQLLDRGGAMDVGRDEHRSAALLAEDVRELRGGRRFARALEADEEQHRWGALRPDERHGLAAEHLDQRVVHDLHDLLRPGDRLDDFLAERALAHGRHELADDLEVHVRLKKGDAHVAQRLLEIGFAHACATAEALERRVQLVGELLEHRFLGYGVGQWVIDDASRVFSSSGATSGPYRRPCTISQPNCTRRSSWSFVSTLSATTRAPVTRAASTIACTASRLSLPSSVRSRASG